MDSEEKISDVIMGASVEDICGWADHVIKTLEEEANWFYELFRPVLVSYHCTIKLSAFNLECADEDNDVLGTMDFALKAYNEVLRSECSRLDGFIRGKYSPELSFETYLRTKA